MFFCPNTKCQIMEERDPKAARIAVLEYLAELLQQCVKDGTLKERLDHVRGKLKAGVGGGGGNGSGSGSGSGGSGGGGGGESDMLMEVDGVLFASEAVSASSIAPVLELDAPRASLERSES